MNPWQKLSFLKSSTFWQHCRDLVLGFAPQCIFPAVIMTIANLIVFAIGAYLISSLKGFDVSGNPAGYTGADIQLALRVFAITAIGLVISMILTLWSTWLWLIRATAFCHLYSKQDEPGDAKLIEPAVLQAMSETKVKQVYLVKVWFFASLYLLLFLIPLMVCFIANSMIMMRSPLFEVPQPLQIFVQIGLVVFAGLVFTYTFVVFQVSGQFILGPHQAAKRAFTIFFKHPIELIGLGFLVVLANALISSPQLLFGFFTQRKLADINFWLEGIGQVWFGLSSLVLWTGSLACVCELVKKLEE